MKAISLTLTLLAICICNGYRIIQQGYSIDNANNICQNTFGSDLASLHSVSDQSDIEQLCSSTCWLGAYHTGVRDANNNCDYAWFDGSYFNESVLSRAGSGEYCSAEQRTCINTNSNGIHECQGAGDSYWPACNEPR